MEWGEVMCVPARWTKCEARSPASIGCQPGPHARSLPSPITTKKCFAGTNLRLGISNETFALADSTLLSALGQVGFMPVLVLAARICPEVRWFGDGREELSCCGGGGACIPAGGEEGATGRAWPCQQLAPSDNPPPRNVPPRPPPP